MTNLDQNRIDSMITVALTDDPERMPELQIMAERLAEPADAFAAFLVGELDRDQPADTWKLPCSTEQWQYFHGRCREATGKMYVNDFKGDLTLMSRYARIGSWPNRLPTSWKWSSQEHYSQAAWAWAWICDVAAIDFIHKGVLPIGPRPASYEEGLVVACGLIDAIKAGLVKVPQECRLRFVVAYAGWYANVRANNGSPTRLCHIFFEEYDRNDTSGDQKLYRGLKKLSLEELQVLAAYWNYAAAELARRRVPLAIPLLQDQAAWAWEYLRTLVLPETAEEAAELWLASTDPVIRYAVALKFWDQVVTDPDDPFGKPIPVLQKVTKGEFRTPSPYDLPNYHQCMTHLRQHS